jgi:hypothetical protein
MSFRSAQAQYDNLLPSDDYMTDEELDAYNEEQQKAERRHQRNLAGLPEEEDETE